MREASRIKIGCRVEEGDLHFDNPYLAKFVLSHYEGKPLSISIDNKYDSKTLFQLGYYWGGIIPCIKQDWENRTGEKVSPDSVHLFLKTRVLGCVPIIETILGVECIKLDDVSIASMSKERFSDYIEKIILYCADEWSLSIPDSTHFKK